MGAAEHRPGTAPGRPRAFPVAAPVSPAHPPSRYPVSPGYSRDGSPVPLPASSFTFHFGEGEDGAVAGAKRGHPGRVLLHGEPVAGGSSPPPRAYILAPPEPFSAALPRYGSQPAALCRSTGRRRGLGLARPLPLGAAANPTSPARPPPARPQGSRGRPSGRGGRGGALTSQRGAPASTRVLAPSPRAPSRAPLRQSAQGARTVMRLRTPLRLPARVPGLPGAGRALGPWLFMVCFVPFLLSDGKG